MKLVIERMNDQYVTEILKWKYDAPYDFYNSEYSQEGINELVENSYYVCLDEDEVLIGFFCIGHAAQVPKGHDFNVYDTNLVDIGLGMRPDLTGRGNGKKLFACILNHVYEITNHSHVRLTVATFNNRAIKLYENFGFLKKETFITARGEFMTMVKVEKV